jgi:putative toxin-antitoxin system antitoxin component (TIGR02293 family)
MTIDVMHVAERLGGVGAIGRSVTTLAELRGAVDDGLPVATLDAIASHLAHDDAEATQLKYRVVPKSTLRRRSRLTPEESERTERLARLSALAERVWEDQTLAREFMTSPQPQLQDSRPIDLARSELGAREVEMVLMRIEHALPA